MKQVILILGIFCLFVFVGCGQGDKSEQPTKVESKAAMENVKETAGAAVETAKEKTQEAVEVVKEKTEETTEAVKEKTGEAVETAKENTQEVVEVVKEETEETAEAVKEKTGEAVEVVKEKTEDTTSAVTQEQPAMVTQEQPAMATQEQPEAAAQEQPALVLEEVHFCTVVEDRQPSGIGTVFPDDLDKIYCFTKIGGAEDTTYVNHVWYFGNDEIARVRLPIKAKSWRTWSSKKLNMGLGNGHVEIVSENGDILGKAEFEIQAAEKAEEVGETEKTGVSEEAPEASKGQ